MTKLETLLQAIRDAEAEVLVELARLYPVGCSVEYRLRLGVPTQIGTVTRHIGGREGEMRVLLATARHEGKRYETTLQARKIIRRTDSRGA